MIIWLSQQKPIIKNYTYTSVTVTEYVNSLEYILTFSESSTQLSEIHTAIVHEKNSHTNTLINFNVIDLSLKPTPNGSITIEDYKNDESATPIIGGILDNIPILT